jgi:acetyl esterase
VLLDQLAAIGGPKVEEVTPAEARELYRAFASLTPMPEVASLDEHGVGDITVHVIRPLGVEDTDGPLPVLVWYHGGGWTIGDLTTSDATAAELANSAGCVAVNVGYRLAPEHPFPTPLNDCFAALEWVVANATALHIDANRLAVGGDSAGGNLAAAVCLLAAERGGPDIRFQLLVNPALDARCSHPSYRENGEGYLLTAATMHWFWANYLGGDGDPEAPLVSPLYAPEATLADMPPALIITGEFDPLRDEGEAYAHRLSQAGVLAEASRYDGMIHNFLTMPAILEAGRKAVDEAAHALRAAL